MKLLLILLLFTASQLFSQEITLPASTPYLEIRDDSVIAIFITNIEEEFDSTEAVRKIVYHKKKRVEVFSVTSESTGKQYWIPVKVVRRVYKQQYATWNFNNNSSNYYESYNSTQCTGTTLKGYRCHRMTKNPSGGCWQH